MLNITIKKLAIRKLRKAVRQQPREQGVNNFFIQVKDKEKEYFYIKYYKELDYWENYDNNSNVSAERFSALETGIASVILSFVVYGIFDNALGSDIKQVLFIIFILISASIIFGLINIHIKQKFWNDLAKRSNKLIGLYFKEIENKSYDVEKIKIAENMLFEKEDFESPKWPWIAQTISFILSIMIMTAFLFYYIF